MPHPKTSQHPGRILRTSCNIPHQRVRGLSYHDRSFSSAVASAKAVLTLPCSGKRSAIDIPGISLDCAALSTPDGVQICTRIKFQSLTLGRSFRFCILICLCRLFFGICTAATMHVPSCVAYLIAVGMTLMESFQTRGRGVVHEVALRRMFLSPLLCPK